MLQIFKKKQADNGSGELKELKKAVSGSWVNVVSPSLEEIEFIEKEFNISPDVIHSVLDSDAMPRIERDSDEGYYLVILRAPLHSDDGPTTTVPLGLFFLSGRKIIMTVSSYPLRSIAKIIEAPSKKFCTDNKALFAYELLRKIIRSYMRELSKIEAQIDTAEQSIKHSVQNKEVILLLFLQKTLVYFRTGIVGNRTVLNKLFSSRTVSLKEYEKELLGEIIVDVNEASQLIEIHAQIIANTITAYNSIVSNNFNTILRFLALVTVSISIPTMVASFYGMNVDLPFRDTHYAFLLVVGIALIATFLVLAFFKYKKLV